MKKLIVLLVFLCSYLSARAGLLQKIYLILSLNQK